MGVPKFWTEDKLHKLGQDLVDHCKKDNVFHLIDWISKKGKTASWWFSLRKDYPLLVDYHERAREILGNKIVTLAFNAGNNWAIQTFVPKYLDDVEEYLDKKKEKELIAAEKAKKLADVEISEKAQNIVDAADLISKADHDSSK